MTTQTIADRLAAMPTLGVGQTDDRKIDSQGVRVWLSRMTKEDGEAFDRRVTIEAYRDGRWVEWASFDGDRPGVLSLVTGHRIDGDDVQRLILEAIAEPVA